MFSRTTKIAVACLLMLGCWFTYTKVHSQSSQVPIPSGLRANKNTYSPLMDVLGPKRPRVTDEQLAKIKTLQIENLWGAVQNKGYKNCFVNYLKMTQPGLKMVGRATTLRYLPIRPDVDEAVQQLAKEGD